LSAARSSPLAARRWGSNMIGGGTGVVTIPSDNAFNS
jgi:hypothetical protein